MRRSSLFGLFLIIIGVVFLVMATNSSFSWDSIWSKVSKDINMEKQFSVDQASTLDIQTTSTNIEFVKSNDGQGRAHLNGKVFGWFGRKMELDVEERQGLISIQSKHNGIGIGYFSTKLVVELPDKVWDQLNIQSTSGNLNIKELQAAESNIKLTSGNLTIQQLHSQKASITSTSGNVKVEKSPISSLYIKNTSGVIKADILETTQLEFKNTSGNVNITGQSVAVDGKTTSGNIRLTVDEIIGDSSLSATSGNVYVTLNKKPTDLGIDFVGTSGNGRIKKDGFKYTRDGKNSSFSGAFGEEKVMLKVKITSGNFTLE